MMNPEKLPDSYRFTARDEELADNVFERHFIKREKITSGEHLLLGWVVEAVSLRDTNGGHWPTLGEVRAKLKREQEDSEARRAELSARVRTYETQTRT